MIQVRKVICDEYSVFAIMSYAVVVILVIIRLSEFSALIYLTYL